MSKRSDIHAPSNINPEDYVFIAAVTRDYATLSGCEFILFQRKLIEDHMANTKGRWSAHEHGGNCHICGAHNIHYAVFYHEKTNTYIQTGFDCAEKMDIGDPNIFKKVKTAREAALKAKAGILKAEGLLKNNGLWDFTAPLYKGKLSNPISIQNCETIPKELLKKYHIFDSILSHLIRYGDLTENQWKFLETLKYQILNFDEIQRKNELRRESTPDAPAGRFQIVGTVISIKKTHSDYGVFWKYLVKTEQGYKVWSTVPKEILKTVEKGDKITFKVTLKPSNDDSKFAYGSRPTCAKIIEKKY